MNKNSLELREWFFCNKIIYKKTLYENLPHFLVKKQWILNSSTFFLRLSCPTWSRLLNFILHLSIYCRIFMPRWTPWPGRVDSGPLFNMFLCRNLMPEMDSLARKSRLLTHAYTLPVCTPSRAAFLTGVYPFRWTDSTPWIKTSVF